ARPSGRNFELGSFAVHCAMADMILVGKSFRERCDKHCYRNAIAAVKGKEPRATAHRSSAASSETFGLSVSGVGEVSPRARFRPGRLSGNVYSIACVIGCWRIP